MATSFLPYSSTVETKLPDEDHLIAEIGKTFAEIQRKAHEKSGHAMRDAHAKSHGILVGELEVYDNMDSAYRQGAFQTPGKHPVILRFSTSPSEIQHDKIGGFRGLGLKILNVEGDKCFTTDPEVQTQDFLFINHPVFATKDIRMFLKEVQVLDNVMMQVPEPMQEAQSAAARMVGKAANAVGLGVVGTALGLATPEYHCLGETYYTTVPVRYGDYVAKISVAPVSQSLMPLKGKEIDVSEENAMRAAVVDFFHHNEAEYELRVQLCTNLDDMPVEDASVEWSEEKSPFVAVGRIHIHRQEAYSDARSTYAEDALSFSPWHCLVAHQPFGSLMRARRPVYEHSSHYRHNHTGTAKQEPRTIEDIPN